MSTTTSKCFNNRGYWNIFLFLTSTLSTQVLPITLWSAPSIILTSLIRRQNLSIPPLLLVLPNISILCDICLKLYYTDCSPSICCCSVAKFSLTLFNLMNCSTPGFPVLHYLLEFAQTHVHWFGDAIQSSHSLSPPSPPALNLSWHKGLFQWACFQEVKMQKKIELVKFIQKKQKGRVLERGAGESRGKSWSEYRRLALALLCADGGTWRWSSKFSKPAFSHGKWKEE